MIARVVISSAIPRLCEACRKGCVGRLADGNSVWEYDLESPEQKAKWKSAVTGCGHEIVSPRQSRGLGDTVAKAIKTVTRGKVRPCGGCKRRQEVLNRLVPYTKSAETLTDYFDRVVLLNLSRRPDRLEETMRHLAEVGWPFKDPERFEGVDGHWLPVPNNWPQVGGRYGAWGCMQSHRQILERAIMDGIDSILVIEDDIELRHDFPEQVSTFLADVPDDWEMLLFGGQNFARPELVKPGVVRCTNTQRTHAYAVRGHGGLHELYSHWTAALGHCDHRLAEFQPKHRVYMPEHQIAGQRASVSDISGGNKGSHFWDRQVKPKPRQIPLHAERFAEMVKGKTVAIVGNAATANEFDHAERIDGADVVIRFNRFQLGERFPNVGTRTDILAVPLGWSPAIPPDEELARMAPKLILACCPPQTSVKPDERDKNYWRLIEKHPIAWLPVERLEQIKRELGKRPTTGLFLLDYLLNDCQPASVYATGFSFERMKRDHYFGGPFAHGIHDVVREGEYVAKRWDTWAKVLSVDPHMQGKLSPEAAIR